MARDPEMRFAYMLAARLGIADPRAMLETMSARVLAEWQQYAALEPLDDRRGDLRAALVASTVANVHGAKTRLRDFELYVRPGAGARPRKSVEQMGAIVRMAAAAAGGKGANTR